MSSLSKSNKSRKQWKTKAISRGDENRYFRKENARIKGERDRYKAETKEYKARLEQMEQQNKMPVLCTKTEVVRIALQLFLVARISFRAVSRVLGVLGHYLGLTKAPCPQTVINWVTRLSIARIQHSTPLLSAPLHQDPSDNGFIWMIDISIALGAGKILALLALDVRHHQRSPGAPSLQNVHCVAVSVALSWTGEEVAAFLRKVMAVVGQPSAFLKDGGSELAKAARLLEEDGFPTPSIADISHRIANLLKHAYSTHPLFETFLSACGKASQKLHQTVLACLAPPKVSAKGRFMNLHRLVVWADRLLRHSPAGGAAKGSLLARLRESLDQLPACKGFLRGFLRDATALLACQKLLKTRGLSYETGRECEALIEGIPPSSPVRIGFTNWIEEQLQVAEALGVAETGLPISSDPIESLFGVAKNHGAGETKDAHRLAVLLPALCGPVTEEEAQRVLEISVAQQEQLLGSFSSLTRQRRDILPNPGRLETLALGEGGQNFELIPRAENRPKNVIILNDIKELRKNEWTRDPLESRALSPPRDCPVKVKMAQ